MPDKEKDLFKSIAEENQWEAANLSLGQRFLSGSQGIGSSSYYYPPPNQYPVEYPIAQNDVRYPHRPVYQHINPLHPTPPRVNCYPAGLVPTQYPNYAGGDAFSLFGAKEEFDTHPQRTPQPTSQSVTAHSLGHASSNLVNIPSQITPAIPMKLIFSASGFDIVAALVKMATRENPKVIV
jgi:hypothetical protein